MISGSTSLIFMKAKKKMETNNTFTDLCICSAFEFLDKFDHKWKKDARGNYVKTQCSTCKCETL